MAAMTQLAFEPVHRLSMIIVFVSVLVCSCSQLGQTVTIWYVTRQLHGYFDLDQQQKAFVKARLVHQLDIVQLYDQQSLLYLLDALKQDIQEGVTEEALQTLYDTYEVIVSRIVLRVLPDVSVFLATLSDRQLDHLVKKLANDQHTEEKNSLAISAQERTEDRDRGVLTTVEAWTGRLSAAQRHAVLTWYHEIPLYPNWWDTYQQEQFERFIGFLHTDPGASRIEYEMIRLWRSPDMPRSQEVRNLMDKRRAGWHQFFIKMNATLSMQQRSRVVAKLDHYKHRLRRFLGTG